MFGYILCFILGGSIGMVIMGFLTASTSSNESDILSEEILKNEQKK